MLDALSTGFPGGICFFQHQQLVPNNRIKPFLTDFGNVQNQVQNIQLQDNSLCFNLFPENK